MTATDKDLVGRSGRGRTALFREETLTARHNRWLGTVVLDTHPWQRGFTLFAVGAVALMLGLLYFGEFTRTARVSGWLVPVGGVARVFAPQPGVVTALHVQEGAPVRKGDRLATLSNELNSTALGATQAQIVRQLDARRRLLVGQREQKTQLASQQSRALGERLAALRFEQGQLEREIALQKSHAQLAERTESRHRELHVDGFISEQQYQKTQEARLEQAGRLSTLARSRSAMMRERLALEAELKDLPLKTHAEIVTLERDIAEIEQELAQAEAQREIVVTAPADGTVTSILAEPGGQAGAARPLLSIVPAGAHFEAHLFSPSRAVGFVNPGQQVLLRYQAYPYQKFGHYEGIVDSVSRSVLNPGELPAPLAVSNAPGSAAAGEPVYRITVKLLQQNVTAYGRALPLHADMRLEADIALETRRLYEWVLDPLYTIAGRKPQG